MPSNGAHSTKAAIGSFTHPIMAAMTMEESWVSCNMAETPSVNLDHEMDKWLWGGVLYYLPLTPTRIWQNPGIPEESVGQKSAGDWKVLGLIIIP
jgi:hypothetical protein